MHHDPEAFESNRYQSNIPDEGALLIIQNLPWSGSEEVILDYGCGTGSATLKYIYSKAKEFKSIIHGVDCSETMVDYAQTHFKAEGVQYSVGNIMTGTELPSTAGYDKIISFFALQCIKEYGTVLEKFYKNLKLGGHIGLTFVTRTPHFHLLQTLGEYEKWKTYMEGYQNYIPYWIENNSNPLSGYEQCLNGIGYEPVFFRLLEQKHHYETLDPLIALLVSFNPFLHKIPKELHEELRFVYEEEFTKLYKPQDASTAPDSKWWNNFSHELLCVVARKPVNKTT